MGSWPAKMIATALGLNDALVVSTDVAEGLTDKLKANDIDVYFGSEGSGVLELVPGGNAKKSVVIGGIELELNTLRVTNFCVKKLLANNDINATAVAFEVSNSGNDSELSASPEFWEFLSTGRLKMIRSGKAKDRSIVRIFYKAFDMSLEIEGRDDLLRLIGKEVIYKSHMQKIEEMGRSWEESPFTSDKYKFLSSGRGGNEYKIVEIPKPIQCASCTNKSANKKCKHSCCKKCCLEKQVQSQEACKAHKKVLVAVAAPTGGVADQDSSVSNED
jgi:hypothetical protein